MAYGTITITYSDGQFVEIPLESPAVTIGRAPDNTIVLDAPGIAAHHARIARTDAGVGLEDYTADGRTRVDGVPLLPGEYHALASGSRIELGSVTISLSLIPPTPAAAPPSDVDLLAALLGTQAAAPQQRGRITRPLGSIAPPVAVEPPAPPAPDSRGARRERTTMPLAPPTIHERPTTPIPTAPPPASPGVAVLPEAPPEASAPPPAPASEQLISISPEDLGAQEVAVEQIATYRITVTNLSRLADGVVIRVEGVPPEWVKITRADGAGWNLLPDQGNTLEAEIAIRPPRAPSSWAGDYDIAVVVGLQVQSEQQRTARGRLTVLPFDDHAVSELDPEVVKDWWRGTYTLTIHNRGNHPQAFTVSADSDDHTLGFRFRQLGVRRMAGDRSKERVVVEPDQQARVRLTVTARGRARRLIGNERTHGFDVDVVPASGPPLPALRGDFIQYPLFRNWIIPLALVTMAGLLIVSCVALAFRELPEICARRPLPVICPAPAVTVAPTAAPTLAPTLAPTAAPTLAPPTEAPPPTLPPPPPTVDVGPTLTAIALVAAQTGTAVAGASDAEKTAAAQTQVALLTAVAQTQVAQLTLVAQTQAAQQTAFAQTQVARETAALQTQVAQETAFAQTQVARETAAAAGARLTETAIARDSFATQTAFAFQLTQTSIAATQTALARPTNTPTPTSTPTNTPTPTPTPVADEIVTFAAVNGVPVTARQPIGGSEYLDQSVSICIFGVAPGSVTPISPSLSASPVPVGLLPDSGASTSVGSAAGAPAPGELMLFSRALQADPTVRCRPAADDVLTDVIPGLGLGSGGYTYQGRPVLTLPLAVYPPRQGFNSEVPFLTADQGENEFLPGLFGVVTFQRNIYQARVEIFNSNTAPGVVFVAYALDESGQVANTSQLVLSVPGPYVLNVVSPRPETLRIRQVLIVAYESDLEGGREVVQLPIVLRRVEINFQPR